MHLSIRANGWILDASADIFSSFLVGNDLSFFAANFEVAQDLRIEFKPFHTKVYPQIFYYVDHGELLCSTDNYF